ncbi:MAG TPA: T9SS type A sorting domain-containing protein [Nitrospinaceae bacterium]|nr:T9SS type A sorting domain-containing protein [Nitrospinaceae bacterium]
MTDSWQFEWVAPSLGVGPVTFYVAGNASNGGNNNSGDKIYTSNTTITGPGVGIDKIDSGINIDVFPSLFQNDIHIIGLENRESIISVYQINGVLVHKYKSEGEKEMVLVLSRLDKGVYILYINDGKHVYTDKVFKSN